MNCSSGDQQQQSKSDNSERDPRRSSSNQNRSIISLSKLKNYMPQNQLTARFFPVYANPSATNQATNNLLGSHVTSSQSNARYRSELDSPDQSSSLAYFNPHHGKLASVKALSLTSQLNLHNCAKESNSTVYNPISCGAQTQQATSQQIANNNQSAANWNTVKGAEPSQVAQQDQQKQRRSLNSSSIEERKRNRIDSQAIVARRGDSTTTEKEADGEEVDRLRLARKAVKHQVEKQQSGSYNKNNMTPSSLLLLQNHNYIEPQHQQLHYHQQQQDQQRNLVSQYTTTDTTIATTNIHQSRRDDSSSVGQVRISGAATDTEDCDAKKSNDNQPSATSNSILPLVHPSLSSSSASASSLMLNNINQFKALDSIGNSSIATSLTNNNNNISVTSSANLGNSSDYSTNQDLNQLNNQLNETDLTTSSANISLNTFQQTSAPYHFKDTNSATDAQQFVNYSSQNSRQTNNHHQNFQASMLGPQMKLENVMNHRSIFEENNPDVVNQGIHIANSTADSLSMARNLARQQARTNIDQYYNNHYNLMPQISSKSSSPVSTTSTPSPKTNAMHSSTSQQQHSNQITSSVCANSSSAQLHLGAMNTHYASVSDTGALHGHQQHQVNQHYPYGAQTTNGQSHHLSMSQHEQSYAHHQQQQLPPSIHHEQQHHQLQQHQQQQQQQQQHHHHQQTVPSQQSIYHHLANNNANMSMNQLYGNAGANAHYQNQLQSSAGSHQTSHLMHGAHQNHHLNSAAAACAAAVVSQTLKTVAHQHSQQHQYGSSIASGFNSTGNLMNMTAQHHQQFHSANQLTNHQLGNQQVTNQHQQQHNLPVHHAASMVTRKYECKMCPQVFMSKAEMKYHNQNHMREAKPYKCLQCPKAFANSSYLSQHMRIHQGVKPYTCDICSRKFTQLSHLQQHKRTHTGDKPYKCNYMNCTKQFSQLSNLQSHSRCHQLDKPYKCNSCYKCFHDEQSLLEHIPRHLESKHLKKNLCIFCGSSYQQERGLVKHFQQYHTDKKPALVAAAIAAGTTGNSNLIASIVSSATPNVNGSSSSSSISSVSSSGSLNVHNNLTIVNVAQGASGGKFECAGRLN